MYWDLDSSGRDHGASRLLSYISRGGHDLENRHGEKMTGEEQEAFIERSEQHQHEKQLVISPKNANDLSDEELSLATRKNMSEFVEDRPTADYCYSIHRDTDQDHVQVAVTGEKRDLYADLEERQGLRRHAREQFHERDWEHEQALEQRREQQIEQEQEQQQDRGPALD